MPIDSHIAEQIDGSVFTFQDRVVCGVQMNIPNSVQGSVRSVTITVPGSYTAIPTLGTAGPGSGATFLPHLNIVSAAVSAPGTGYASSELIALAGGTYSTQAVLQVLTTQVQNIELGFNGQGYTPGEVLTLSGGVFTTAVQITVSTVGALGSLQTFSIANRGAYTTNTTNFTQGSSTGSGSGAVFNSATWGVNTVSVASTEDYTVLPANPVAQDSSTGDGNGATFTLGWGLLSADVLTAGTGYDNTSTLTVSAGAGAGTLNVNVGSGSITSVAITNPGVYASIPTLGTSGPGSGATFTNTVKLAPSSGGIGVVAAGTGYAGGDLITIAGGTFTTAGTIQVTYTQLVSLAVLAGGSGYANSDDIILHLNDGGTSAPVHVSVITVDGGGAILSFAITNPGSFSVNATGFTQQSTSGSGTGATFDTAVYGASATSIAITIAGNYTVIPTAPVSQASTSGSGSGATFNNLTWGFNTIAVSAGGSGYTSSSAMTFTGGGPQIAATATLAINYTSGGILIPVNFPELPNNYGVFGSAGVSCKFAVINKTNNSFNVLLTPVGVSLSAATIDITVWS